MLTVSEGTTMVNSINNSNGFKQVDNGNKMTRSQTTSSENPRSDASTLKLSDPIKQIAALIELAMKQPAINRERVDELKSAIQSNKYEISNEKIASRMLSDAEWAF